MDKDKICKIVNSMLSHYIENKLPPEQYQFVKKHLDECSSCKKRCQNLKNLIKKMKQEYAIDLKKNASANFEEREYNNFKNNLNAYLDNELGYENSIKFKKYIMKSPSARKEVQDVYQMQKLIRESFARTKFQSCPNFTKNILMNLDKNFHKMQLSLTIKLIMLILLISISISGAVMLYKLAKEIFYQPEIQPIITTFLNNLV